MGERRDWEREWEGLPEAAGDSAVVEELSGDDAPAVGEDPGDAGRNAAGADPATREADSEAMR